MRKLSKPELPTCEDITDSTHTLQLSSTGAVSPDSFLMTQRPAPRLDLMPSAADRWMQCPASPRFILENADLLPADTSSRFSQEGTTAHEVAAAFLQDREPKPDCPTPIDADMRWHGWQYAEYVQGLRHPDAGMSKLIVEHKMPLWYYEGRNAIVDAAVINPDSLHIVDLKYGAGVPVSPEENRQLAIYARQILFHERVKLAPEFPVFLHIYQPRCRGNEDEHAQVWESNALGILHITDEIADHASVIQINHKVQGQPLDFGPSEKACRWCPAKAICPAHQAMMLDGIEALAEIDEKKPTLPPVETISVEQTSAILQHKDSVIKWLKEVEAYATQRMIEGHKIPGHKLVLSRGGNRAWRDPKKAIELLEKSTILKRADIVEESVKSPAAIEKLIGKKKFSAEVLDLITKAPGSPVIAPVDDERAECSIRAETEFEMLSGDLEPGLMSQKASRDRDEDFE